MSLTVYFDFHYYSQLLNYSLSRLSMCSTNTMKQIRALASTNKDCIELKALITEHMQTPFVRHA